MNIKKFFVISFHFEENSLDFEHLKVAVFDSCTDAKDFLFDYFEKYCCVTISIRIDKLTSMSKIKYYERLVEKTAELEFTSALEFYSNLLDIV